MNPLAVELNSTLAARSPHVLEMLSQMGKNLFFPKGILSQSAEAKAKAHRFNATIGIATEGDKPMYLPCIHKHFAEYDPSQLYPYAPPAGKPELRQLWREKMLRENPSLKGKHFSLPIVTNALTHGLSMVGDLFVDPGDHLILPDQIWGNYRLTYGVRNQGVFRQFPFFNSADGFNADGFRTVLTATAREKGKAVVILNFPNNPTGYTPTVAEGEAIVTVIREVAEAGCNIVAVTDDAYFGLFYEDSLRESLFGRLANLHPRILAVKIDGATKEEFVWGFRTGFITFADGHGGEDRTAVEILEKKAMGLIRATISNSPHPSQTFVLEALRSPDYPREKEQKLQILKARAMEVKRVLSRDEFRQAWDYYPFNSGYFMCLKLKKVDAEALRVHLLERYGVGTIANNATDLRIAFSCIAKENIAELFDLIHQGVKDLS
ncbi:MAG: aminotransferase class I/II-fold pyridoxal phosphate-dependent enzyme [Deltaproteobacteria bacterium]|nr:aminotransferase class I/II-fold pyridoxal phosphate-dependent enzyme [Deltaproteobacteria bacterium]